MLHFKYLGSTIHLNEVKLRVDCVRRACPSLRKAFRSRSKIVLGRMLCIFRTTFRQALKYACETWPLKLGYTNLLEIFGHGCLRRMIKIKKCDRVSNAGVRQHCMNVERPSSFPEGRRLQSFCRFLRRPEMELTKRSPISSTCSCWKCHLSDQLKIQIITVKADMNRSGLQPVSGVRNR